MASKQNKNNAKITQREFDRTTHPEAQWFPKAGLGLFIHWGISSVAGHVDLSWGMIADTPWDSGLNNENKLTPNEYYALADKFDPQEYDPDEWMAAAKETGFKYAVMTTKHRDGYTMWPSKYGEMGVQTKMGGRDLVKPYVEACRKYGLKVGFYYSPPDWYFDRHYRNWRYSRKRNNGETLKPYDMNHRPVDKVPEKPAGHDEKRVELIRGQIRELLTNYGRIDIFWFDGGAGEFDSLEVREMQPHIVINNRNQGRGDFDHTECRMPEERFEGWFESCHTCWGGWGYHKYVHYEPASVTLTKLVQLRTWGGNLLANVGPMANGKLPEKALARWKEISTWMKHSGESVYDIEPGPYPEKSNVPVTIKGNTWYLHSLPGERKTVSVKDVERPEKVVLLRTKQSIEFEYDNDILKIDVPLELQTSLVDVLAVKW